jgi:hypothetical protein
MSGDPAKARIVMDADAMKRVLDPSRVERRIFDRVSRVCGTFVSSKTLEREYGHAVRRSGGDVNDIYRRLSDLPDKKRVLCRQSAIEAAEGKLDAKALEAFPATDRHLLRAAVTEWAAYIISNDSGVLDASTLARDGHAIGVLTPEKFWEECESVSADSSA